MLEFWTLDSENNTVPCDEQEWSKIINDPRRIVAQDYVNEELVSTVFLGLDHGFDSERVLLFETMIFASGKDYDETQWRCSTWAEAIEQHAEALKLVKADAHAGGKS
jgi:hypothetical protein